MTQHYKQRPTQIYHNTFSSPDLSTGSKEEPFGAAIDIPYIVFKKGHISIHEITVRLKRQIAEKLAELRINEYYTVKLGSLETHPLKSDPYLGEIITFSMKIQIAKVQTQIQTKVYKDQFDNKRLMRTALDEVKHRVLRWMRKWKEEFNAI